MKIQRNDMITKLSDYTAFCTGVLHDKLYFKLNNILCVLNDPNDPDSETSKISLIDYCKIKFSIKDENCQYFHDIGFDADLNLIYRCTGIRKVSLESRSTKYTEKLKL